jgi:alginate O-acetyltransferase complex protein AlgI
MKVILANYAGQMVEAIVKYKDTTITASGAWTGIVTSGLQSDFDVSGYSDMAIGLGLMFGFHYSRL